MIWIFKALLKTSWKSSSQIKLLQYPIAHISTAPELKIQTLTELHKMVDLTPAVIELEFMMHDDDSFLVDIQWVK